MTSIVLIGGGGHARVLVEALRAGGVTIVGFIATAPTDASGVMAAIPFLCSEDEFLTQPRRDLKLVNGVGSIGNPERRRAVYERYRAAGLAFASVVHPATVIASDVTLDDGAQIMAGAIIQPGARIGANAIVNTGACIDHDCTIGAHAHIAPGAVLAGDVIVGEGVHVGAGATIKQGVRVGARSVVGAGAVVIADVAPGITVIGVPATAKKR